VKNNNKKLRIKFDRKKKLKEDEIEKNNNLINHFK
jgi:hypothetical protein